MAYLIKESIGYQIIIEFDTSKLGGTMKKLQDVGKLASLCWQLKIDLDYCIKQEINYYLVRALNNV